MHMPNQREGASEKEHKKKQQTTHTQQLGSSEKKLENMEVLGSVRECALVYGCVE